MGAVHQAMCSVLGVPADDRQIRYVEHRPEHFLAPPGRSENYTIIEITLFSGRSMEAKRRLYQSLVAALGALGIAPLDVFIVLHEVARENWGVRGGIPGSEVDPGFKINV